MTEISKAFATGLLPLGDAAQNGAIGDVAAKKVSDALNIIGSPPPQALDTGKVRNSGSLVSNANGAPSIGNVTMNFSPDDLAAALVTLQSKTQDAQMATAKEGLSTSGKKLEDQKERSLEKIKEWDKKCKSAEAKAKVGGILGWFKKIAMAVAAAFSVAVAAIATVATGGAAAPLLALAVLGLASAVTSLASDIAKATGHKGFDHVVQWMDPGSLVGKGMAELAKKMGADESQASKVAMAFSVATTLGIVIASVVLSGGANIGSVVDKFANTLSSVMKTVVNTTMALSKVAQPVAGIVGGLTDVAQGGINIAVAHDKRDASKIEADRKLGDAAILKLQQQMEEAREDLKKVLEELMENHSKLGQMINASSQSRAQISANLVGKGMSV
ncbi:MAG: type III secretion system translocon subunit SctE [Comamonas sp.]